MSLQCAQTTRWTTAFTLSANSSPCARTPVERDRAARHVAVMTTPPVARKIPQRIEQLGRVRVDDYAWMKDEAWQQVLRDPKVLRADVREHLDAENAYTKAMLAPTEALQAQMFAEMKGRIKEDDSSVPAPD